MPTIPPDITTTTTTTTTPTTTTKNPSAKPIDGYYEFCDGNSVGGIIEGVSTDKDKECLVAPYVYLKRLKVKEIEEVYDCFGQCVKQNFKPTPSPNRKGYFSVDVQAVCDADLNFTNVVARWYGSAYDQRIFENSNLFDILEDGTSPGLLLGDGGYTLMPFVIPFTNPNTRKERRYNTSQIRTRNTVERAFGVVKRRFPCLRMVRLKLSTCLAVTVNVTRRRNDLFMDDEWETNEPDDTHAQNKTKYTLQIHLEDIRQLY